MQMRGLKVVLLLYVFIWELSKRMDRNTTTPGIRKYYYSQNQFENYIKGLIDESSKLT